MKFSERWLREFVDHGLTTEALAQALTMAGLEVEEVTAAAPAFSQVVVGEIVSMERHPNADRLNVCQVDVGTSAPLQIVCGAPNARVGMKAPVARVGAILPEIAIKATKLRGVESWGMLCSAAELGVSEDASGLLELEPDAPVGADFRAHWQLEDSLLTLKLTPNRGDCLSMLGLAREVSAITGKALCRPMIKPPEVALQDRRSVELRSPEGCPLYCGRIIRGIDPRARTPRWMLSRLERSGLRGISPVVDATNFVMLELGQPLHAFDLAKLQGGIHVRFGRAGERLTVLNGQEVALTEDILVIADESGPVALAGVMGGLDSGVGDDTVDLFLEGAYFQPQVIAGRSRRLGFNSDAAHRFERGVDFGGTRAALERLSQLVMDICGGRAGPITEARDALPARRPVAVRPARASSVLGVDLAEEEIESIFERLQFAHARQTDRYIITPPSYRFDLSIEEDVIEEIGRIYGYDHIPPALPVCEPVVESASESHARDSELRNRMVARGYQEIISFSFVPRSWDEDFAGIQEPVLLANPIASHLEAMRAQLLGSLVDCLRQNLNRKRERVRLFELGRVYGRTLQDFHQPLRLAGLAYGSVAPDQWGVGARAVDFFDVKGDLGALLEGLSVTYAKTEHPAFHPGKCATLSRDGKPLGVVGELHPRWVQKYELPAAPILFELDVEALRARQVPRFRGYSRFPLVTRDMAVLVPEGVEAGGLLAHLWRHAPAIVSDLLLFDVYRGKGVEAGKKSLAFRVLLQDTEKTLTDADVDSVMHELLEQVRNNFDGRLRD